MSKFSRNQRSRLIASRRVLSSRPERISQCSRGADDPGLPSYTAQDCFGSLLFAPFEVLALSGLLEKNMEDLS